jgi:predicted component of type VI protein secretion system
MPFLLNKLSRHAPADSLHRRIARDIVGLVNTAVRGAKMTLPDADPTMHSVLNYGNPSLPVVGVVRVEANRLALQIRSTLLRFEPRLSTSTLQVRACIHVNRHVGHVLPFDITSRLVFDASDFHLRMSLDCLDGFFEIASS